MNSAHCSQSALAQLAGCVGADAVVVWKEAADVGNAFVVATLPPDLLVAGSPFPVVRIPQAGLVVERAPVGISALVPASVRLRLPTAPSAALVAPLGGGFRVLVACWGSSEFAPFARAMDDMRFADALAQLDAWYP